MCVCVSYACMHDEWMGGWMSVCLYPWYENNRFGPLELFLPKGMTLREAYASLSSFLDECLCSVYFSTCTNMSSSENVTFFTCASFMPTSQMEVRV